MPTAKLVAAIIAVSAVAVFMYQNTAVAQVNFLFWSAALSVSLLLLGVFLVALLLGWTLCYIVLRKKIKKI
ncbi:lipopolysaccharide assembly protein LapA domain-containing protein [Thermodesulfobacteriota bacterium]